MPRVAREKAKNSGRVNGSIRVRHDMAPRCHRRATRATSLPHPRIIAGGRALNPSAALCMASAEQESSMIALGIIIGFVVVLAAINAFEFGRVD
ncbi:hypothetical protein [Brevundimonas subvibrioides]|uniref:hypothetical protein n=1 Tax=Brevundimonas subvibrioides TaxID=74313 RepID=UPI0032D57CF9